ncbi:putative ankyrin repeat protein L59 [Phytophthora citrophthora]|uniref:Ankyrin repeat protein L59 n=1 Tax=Phytophthora citrophthora TaxID=4793 RepID=A0AAD9G1T8_9STRA|nr:putative ankyrin repeat protein L59 [Phytophthora citrophthora]
MAVTSGRLKLDQYPNGAVHSFVKAGRLDLIKRVCKNLPRDDENLREILAIDEGDSYEWRLVIKEAIRRGDMHMVDWLVKHPIGQASLIAAKAAKTSLEFAIATTDTAMLQYLHNGDLLLAGDYMDGLVHAVQNGQLDAVQWFLLHAANLSNLEQYNLMDEAAKCGHLDILQFFHGSTSSIEEDFLRQIRLKGCSTEAMNDAATNGHLEMIQWLHANRSEGCTTKAMDGAAKGGHLEVIKWLYRNRSEGCTFEAIELAIVTGQLQVACWLRTHGYGQLEVDHWLMEFFVHFSPTEGKHFCPKRELEILLFLHVNYPHVIHVNS